MLRQPLDQKIEPASPTLRTNALPPAHPIPHQRWKSEQPHDLGIGGIIEEADSSPVPIEPANRQLSCKQFTELGLIDVIIPNIG